MRTDRGIVLEARSQNSASALVRAVSIDPVATARVKWSWRIDGVIPQAEWGTRQGDDFPARLFIVFETERGRLLSFVNPRRGLFDGLALNYVWANQGERERMARSPQTDRVVMIAVQAGPARVGVWIHEERNVIEDFARAFGQTATRIRAIAVMTDTDGSRSVMTTHYSDIAFVPAVSAR